MTMSKYMAKVLELEEHPEWLHEAWDLYNAAMARKSGNGSSCTCTTCRPTPATSDFAEVVNEALGGSFCQVVVCSVCNQPEWDDETFSDVNGNIACDSCRQGLPSCTRCDDWSTYRYWTVEIDGNRYCETCRDSECTYCNDCARWYRDDYQEDHDHEEDEVPCECSPQQLTFTIPANSHGVLQQDERLLVELGKGDVTDEAIASVISLLWSEQFRLATAADNYTIQQNYEALVKAVESLERTWQTKTGNFTRRLSNVLYKQLGAKLDGGLLSRAGSLVREHANATNEWYVEFTRNLNQPPEAFYHGDSCWWSSENRSLCAFKHWGGLGMRTYQTEDVSSERPTGRAWVQPLNTNLQPTKDVFGAHAYAVYNGYGALSGYTAARLVAYLTSRTYRRISLSISYQYVNSGGYLIADQATCDANAEVRIRDLEHHQEVAA